MSRTEPLQTRVPMPEVSSELQRLIDCDAVGVERRRQVAGARVDAGTADLQAARRRDVGQGRVADFGQAGAVLE